MRFGVPLLFGALCLGAVSAQAADPVPSLDLRAFHPPTDPGGFLYLEPASTPGARNWNIGGYVSYALSPVVLNDPSGHELAHVISHQVSFDYFANVGIGKTWSVALTVPTVVYQTGDDVSKLLPGSTELPHTALGAVSVSAKKTLVSPSELGGLGIAALGRFDIPTDASSYVSDRLPGGELRLLGELDLLAIAVRATAGFHARANETFLRNGTDRYTFGNDIPWGAGVTLRPQALGMDRGGHFRWTAEVHGNIAATPNFAARPESPVVIGLSSRYSAKNVSALIGLEIPANDAIGTPVVRPVVGLDWAPRFEDADGDGIEDDLDQCPELAEDKDGFEDQDGCPDFDNDDDGVPDDQDKCPTAKEDSDDFQDDDGCPDPDNDGDGIPDAQDKCPNEPEDKDGFQDADGCPDPDNDQDGVPDAQDKCPDQPETKNGYQDADGCPDEIPAKIKKFTGVIQGINFKVNSSDLLSASNGTLDKAVEVLKEFPDLKMEIQGHTDDQPMGKGGKFADNTALSQARAESVKAYFVKSGIEDGRLTPRGYGATMPIDDPKDLKGAKLNAARAKNRRVEFKLISNLTGGGDVTTTPPPAAAPASGPVTSPAAKPAAPAPATPAPAKPAPAPLEKPGT
jgi:outer membrane protein OmpA-like peptidoglycan-associated protein